MNSQLKKIVSILLAMILVINVVPVASAGPSRPVLLQAAPTVAVTYNGISAMPFITVNNATVYEYAIVAFGQGNKEVGYAELEGSDSTRLTFYGNDGVITPNEGTSFWAVKLKGGKTWRSFNNFDTNNDYTKLESESGILGDYSIVKTETATSITFTISEAPKYTATLSVTGADSDTALGATYYAYAVYTNGSNNKYYAVDQTGFASVPTGGKTFYFSKFANPDNPTNDVVSYDESMSGSITVGLRKTTDGNAPGLNEIHYNNSGNNCGNGDLINGLLLSVSGSTMTLATPPAFTLKVAFKDLADTGVSYSLDGDHYLYYKVRGKINNQDVEAHYLSSSPISTISAEGFTTSEITEFTGSNPTGTNYGPYDTKWTVTDMCLLKFPEGVTPGFDTMGSSTVIRYGYGTNTIPSIEKYNVNGIPTDTLVFKEAPAYTVNSTFVDKTNVQTTPSLKESYTLVAHTTVNSSDYYYYTDYNPAETYEITAFKNSSYQTEIYDESMSVDVFLVDKTGHPINSIGDLSGLGANDKITSGALEMYTLSQDNTTTPKTTTLKFTEGDVRTVVLNLYGYDKTHRVSDSAPYNDDDDYKVGLTDYSYAMVACLYDKTSGEMIGYAAETGITLTEGLYSTKFYKFVATDASGTETEGSAPIIYDPDQHEIKKAYIYQIGKSETWPSTYAGITAKQASITNYKFREGETGNSINGELNTLYADKAFPAVFKYRIRFDNGASAIDASDKAYVYVDVLHIGNDHSYYLGNLATNGTDSVQDFIVSDGPASSQWVNSDDTILTAEDFTGNEQNVTVRVVKFTGASGSLTVNNIANSADNHALLGVNEIFSTYKVISYPSKAILEKDEENHIDYYVYEIVLSKTTASDDYDIASVLGQGINYGITADRLQQGGSDYQSNFAVNYYQDNGKGVNPNLSGANAGAIAVGNFVQFSDGGEHGAGENYEVIALENIDKDSNYGTIDINASYENAQIVLFTDSANRLKFSRQHVHTIITSATEVANNIVEPIISHMESVSANLLHHESNVSPLTAGDKVSIDTTAYPDNVTLYVDGDALKNKYGNKTLSIRKKENQVIVFNYATTTDVTIDQYLFEVVDDAGTVTRSGNSETSTSNALGADKKNENSDYLARHMIWNLANAKNITIDNVSGSFLIPREDSSTLVDTTSAGWIISDGFIYNKGEWHNVYANMKRVDKVAINAYKKVDGKNASADQKFNFEVNHYLENGGWSNALVVVNDGSTITYTSADNELYLGWNVYKITETGKVATTLGTFKDNTQVFYAAVRYQQFGNYYAVSSPMYYTGFDPAQFDHTNADPTGLTGPVAAAEVKFDNEQKKSNLKLSKTVAESAYEDTIFTFAITLNQPAPTTQNPDAVAPVSDVYTAIHTDKDGDETTLEVVFTNGRATVTLKPDENIEIIGIPVGFQYAISETKAGDVYFSTTGYAGEWKKGNISGATGTIEESVIANATFENNYKSNKALQGLQINKAVTGEGAPTTIPNAFTFSATNKSKPSSVATAPAFADVTNSGGTVSFAAVKFDVDGEYIYEIAETGMNAGAAPGFSQSSEKVYAKITVTKSGTTYSSSVKYYSAETCATGEELTGANIKITNLYTSDKGNLTITKATENLPINSSTKKFKIRVKLGTTVYAQDGSVANDDGYVEFTSGQTQTWNNLPVGTYTVEEDETDADIGDDYSLVVTGVGDIQVDKTHTATAPATVTVKNTYTKLGKIIVDKKVLVNGVAPNSDLMDGEYYFALFNSTGTEINRQLIKVSGNGTIYTPRTTIEFKELKPDTYTIKEMKAYTGTETYVVADVTVTVQADEEKTVTTANFKTVTVNGDEHTVHFVNDRTYEGSIVIKKHLSGETATSSAKKTFEYTVTSGSGSTIKYYNADGTIGDANSKITLTLPDDATAGKTVSHLKPGTYTVTEIGTNLTTTYKVEVVQDNGNKTEAVSTSVVIADDSTHTVEFTNTLNVGTVKVTKIFSGITATQKPADFRITNDYNNTVFTYANADNKDTADGIATAYEWTITNVPVGKQVTFTESNADVTNYTLVATADPTGGKSAAVVKDGTVTVALTNTYTQDVGSVKVTKIFSGITATQKPADFRITNDYNNTVFTYANADNKDTADGIATVYEWTITNVPVGKQVTFTESNADVTNYTLVATADPTSGKSAAVVKNGTVAVALTNTYTQDVGAVKVTKIFSGITATQKPADFRITNDYNNTVFTYANADNKDTADGITTAYEWTITNVPVGKQVTFTESNADVTNYTLVATADPTDGKSAAVVKDGSVTVALTNTYTQDVGSVKVTKIFSGITATQKPADFRITNDFNNTVFTYANADNKDTADGITTAYEWTITNVPVGKQVTFTESNADVTNYTLVATADPTDGKSAAVVKDGTVTVALTNTYTQDVGSVKVTKIFSGITATQKPADFRITNDYNNTVFTYANADNKDTADGITTAYEWTITGVPVGKQVTFTESNADVTNYALVATADPTSGKSAAVVKNGTVTVALTNTYTQDVGSVKVTKIFSGITATQKPADFRITNDYNNTVFTYANADNKDTADGIATAYEWTITNVPVGKQVTFTESNADVTNYTLVATADPTGGKSAAVVKDGTVTVALTNAYTQDVGSVEVTKYFTGTPELPKGFQIVNDYNDKVFTAANADSGDGLTTPFVWKIENVPVKTVIKFTESNTEVEGYTLSEGTATERTSKAVIKDATVSVTFQNKYTQDVGSVVVTKTFTGTPVLPEGFQIKNDYNDTVFTAETADSGDGLETPFQWTIKDVPVGTVITFTESNTAIDGYILSTATVTEKKCEAVVKDSTVTVAFENNYTHETGKLKVTKTVQVNGAAPTSANEKLMDGTYTFKVYATDADGKKTGEALETISIVIAAGETAKTVVSAKEYDEGEYIVEEDPADLLVGENGRKVTVTAGKKLESEIPAAGTAEFTNNITEIFVKKVDVADGKELAGAKIQILDENGKVIDEWTSDDSEEGHSVSGLTAGGTYTLHEEVAPEGYTIAADTTFVIDASGKVTSGTTKVANGCLLVEDAKTHIKVQKRDITTEEELTGAHIQVLDKDGNIVEEWDSDKNAPHEVTGLKTGEEYTLRETVAPKGYDVTTDTKFTIDEEGVVTTSGNKTTDENGDVVLLVEDAAQTTTIAVRKAWKDENNRDGLRPISLTVRLKMNGTVVATRQLTIENNWTWVEKELRKCDADGNEIEYSWEEDVPKGYTLESTKSTGMLTTLTNAYTAETTSVSVKKTWNDEGNKYGTRPAGVKVQLFANGKAEGDTVTLNEANGWTYTWKGLYKYENPTGKIGTSKEITYTVAELEVPAGYTMSVSGNAAKGFEITNSITRGKLVIEKIFDIEEKPEVVETLMDIPVEKIWDDNDNKDGNRPQSIVVKLLRGGAEIDRVTLNEGNGWRHTFTDLPQFKNNLTIRYSIQEEPVEGYMAKVEGFTITNTYMPKQTSVTVRKLWDDFGNDAQRPKSITMYLSNGKQVVLNDANGWTATVANLPAVVNGQPATYTWIEEKVPGYVQVSVEVTGNLTTFTNKPAGEPDTGSKNVKTGGDTWAVFEEYDTALGGQLLINHVGDCFD